MYYIERKQTSCLLLWRRDIKIPFFMLHPIYSLKKNNSCDCVFFFYSDYSHSPHLPFVKYAPPPQVLNSKLIVLTF